MSRKSVPPLLASSNELMSRRVRVEPRHVVFLKGVIEASEGLACVFAESGGDLVIACPRERVHELDRLLDELAAETDLLVEKTHPPATG